MIIDIVGKKYVCDGCGERHLIWLERYDQIAALPKGWVTKDDRLNCAECFAEKNVSLCPCSGECCEKPDTFNPEHTCSEDVCEGCFVSECRNCGGWCVCDL